MYEYIFSYWSIFLYVQRLSDSVTMPLQFTTTKKMLLPFALMMTMIAANKGWVFSQSRKNFAHSDLKFINDSYFQLNLSPTKTNDAY